MHAEFVTEVSSQQPTVIIIGSPSFLVQQIQTIYQQQAIPTVNLAPQSVADMGISSVGVAYKCIWVHDPTKPLSGSEIEKIAGQVRALQVPTIQVFPIITPIEESHTQNQAMEAWLRQSQTQNQQILALNAAVPEAPFIFLQDLVLEHQQQPWHALYFCTTQVGSGQLLDPEIEIAPLHPNTYEQILAEQLFRPSLSGSLLLHAEEVNSTQLLRQAQSLYRAYHSTVLKLTVTPVAKATLLPFSVIATEVASDLSTVLSSWVRILPAPSSTALQTDLAVKSPTVSQLPAPMSAVNVQAQASEEPPLKTVAVQPQSITPTSPVQVKSAVQATQEIKTVERPVLRKSSSVSEPSTLDVSEELQRIFKPTRKKQKVSQVVATAKTQETIKKKSKRRTGLFYGGLGIIGLGLGVLVLAAVFFTTQFLVRRQVASALRETIEQQSVSQTTQTRLEQLNGFLAIQLDAYSTIFDSVMLVEAVSLSELGTELIEVTDNLNQARQNTISLALVTLGKDSGDSSEYAQKLALSAQQAYENLSLIQARVEQVTLPIGNEEADVVILEFTKQLQELRQVLAVEQQLHPLLPTLFGHNSRKTYALVLQNDQELRPTGGFIEAVALLRFENGSLISTDVYSSYEIDKKLVGTVAPPEEIKQFLAEENWYLRDSNWDPHFPATANKISWFIDKSLGTKVDGVIAVNTQVVADLIEALGPIDIPQYNETLTHRNLAERMEFHSEVVLVDSSTTEYYPKIVLTNVVHRLSSIQPEKVTAVLDALYQSLQTHQAAIAIFDDATQETLATFGWSGEIINPACPTQISNGNCVVDELAQVEANVGVNKANYYLQRSVTHTATLQADHAEHHRKITYQNTAQSNAWPKGAYKSYVRFYLPHDAQVSRVVFNGQEVAPELLIQRQELGRPVLGVLIEVPTQETRLLEVIFSTPLPSENKFAYAFFDQKQPGLKDQSHAITLVPRTNQQPVVIAPQADVTPTGIVFSELSDEHRYVGTRFE